MQQYKQNFNGKQGEDRTRQILGKHFIYNVRSIDIDGIDFFVELPPQSRTGLNEDRIQVKGRVQSKFFENNNEVTIAREYAEDENGNIRTDFFALLHTDDTNENEIYFFFTAKDIKEQFRLRDDYFIFSLSKERKFEKFKNISKVEINRKIEWLIRSTEEYKNQKFISSIEENYKTINFKSSTFDNQNQELFERIKNKPIVDKLYEVLFEFKDFRRIIPWRLVNKMSFKDESKRTFTFTNYSQFCLSTNNSQILDFFKNLEVNEEITIRNRNIFKNSKNSLNKSLYIVNTLNSNLIFNVRNNDTNETIDIKVKNKKVCDCISCNFYILNFKKAYSLLRSGSQSYDLWDKMQYALIWLKFGFYEKAIVSYEEIALEAMQNKQEVILFLAKLNHKLTTRKNFDAESPDLNLEIEKVALRKELKKILNSLDNYTLLNGFRNEINEIYLKIKDYKQREYVNNTLNLINRSLVLASEYLNFINGNWIALIEFEESDLLFERLIESCLISYSLSTDFSDHFSFSNDSLVEISIHYCNSEKLLSFFQKNNIQIITYKSKKDYLKKALFNFFSNENVDFLINEVGYTDDQVNNYEFRRRVKRTFSNLITLLTYLDFKIDLKGFIDSVIFFIIKLDFTSHDIYTLSHLILKKSDLFSETDILKLLKTLLLKKKLSDGFLITNCLYVLEEKKHIFSSDESETINLLIQKSIKDPRLQLLDILPKVLDKKDLINLQSKIKDKLATKFDNELYYDAITSSNIRISESFFYDYLNFIDKKLDFKTETFLSLKSPFTGIHDPLRTYLNELVEIFFVLNNQKLLQNKTIKKIIQESPYYSFILNHSNFDYDSGFNILWLLENQSKFVLKEIGKNDKIKFKLKSFFLKEHNKNLLQIYARYFSN